jgi:sulfite exporter TauE/SafE/copper chaperone CopZ/plastocyanin
MSKPKSCTYSVSGTHCRSCEVLIEKEISRQPGVKSVKASTKDGIVTITYRGSSRPQIHLLNQLFQDNHYVFSDSAPAPSASSRLTPFIIALLFVAGYYLLESTGIISTVSVNTDSLLIAFFGFGLLAGFSTCAALVGGIVLSLARQWHSLYSSNDSTFQKLEPHFIFNLGRITVFTFFGLLLGLLGQTFRLSLASGALITIAVSVLMLVIGLQLLNIKPFTGFQLSLPRFITRRLSDEANFQGKYMPFLMGAATFFLPCGFTLTAQTLALGSGDPITGALIMLLFTLGTSIPLLLIGLSSIKAFSTPQRSSLYSYIAGFLIIFFSLFNINSQLSVLDLPNLSTILASSGVKDQKSSLSDSGLPPIVDGKQILKMNASASGYSPNYLKVRAGTPVRWEIKDTGTSGCTNAVISRNLFQGQINLVPGTTSVKEFTPTTPGKYRFTCWMGMVSGTLEVVASK